MYIGEKIVKIAFAEVGTVESPKNSNRQKYGEWFGFNGVAWCAIFVSWCYAHAGVLLKGYGYKKGFAGCQSAAALFRKNGEVITREQLRVGDIILFDWNGDGRYDHVGIFNGWANAERTIAYTLEGNTSATNQSNGGEVQSRKRDTTKISCLFAHPKVLDAYGESA